MKKVFSSLIYISILVLTQLPWFLNGGNHYTIYGLYSYAEEMESAGATGDIGLFRVQIIMIILYQIICAIYLVTVLLEKNWHLNVLASLLGLVGVMIATNGLGNLAENNSAIIYPSLLALMNIIELIVPGMMEAMKEEKESARNQVLREKQEKEEKKRRLRFAGIYKELFYQVVWKDFIYNIKDYILFILCGVMVSSLSFIGFGSYEMMVNVHSEEKFLIGAGLGRILLKAMLPIGTGSVILMVFVLIFYLKKRMISYSMFLVLGARKKTLYIRMALEICFSLICSLVFGCLLGNGILFFLRKGIAEFIGNEFLLSRVTWLSGLKMFGVTVLIYLVSFMGARDIARDMHLVSASARKVRGEKMPWKGLRLLLIAGIVLLVWSVFSYSQLRNFEDIKLLGVYFVGVFLVLRYGGAAYLHK